MNFARLALNNRTTTLFLSALVALIGVASFFTLGQLEDPTFTVKTALVVTAYPGASAEEVEQEITELLETRIQELEELWRVRSLSRAGVSIIYVDIQTSYTKDELPQIWDKMRSKVGDAQASLPPGAGPSMVTDDYGDVFGIYYALTGEGYSYRDLWHVADFLKRELSLVEGVKRAEIAGEQRETIYIEMPRARMVKFGISPEHVAGLLAGQNLITDSGSLLIGDYRLRVSPTGAFDSVESIGALVIATGTGVEIRLSDVADIRRDFIDPPAALVRSQGKNALTIGISNIDGANVPSLGRRVAERLEEIKSQIPVGMDLHLIYNQPKQVEVAVRGFLVNLAQAVILVVSLLLVFTGLRNGILMGAVLLFTIIATFMVMKVFGIDLHSVSLAALIIALGMLVDNAIVISDGMLVRLQQGKKPEEAAEEIVGLTTWPMFGATIIGILAFAPIGLSPDNTGEYCFDLFAVVGIALLLSWITAIVVTPLWGAMFLKKPAAATAENPYDGKAYRLFRRLLHACARFRYVAIGVIVALLFAAFIGFNWVERTFFPPDPKPLFTVDVWLPQGVDIAVTSREIAKVEAFLARKTEVVDYTAFIGSGAMRFILNYTPADPSPRYAQMLVETKSGDNEDLMRQTREFLAMTMPDAVGRVSSLQKGSASGDHIEARFLGDDPDELRRLADKAMTVLEATPYASGPRLDWGNRVFSLQPAIIETHARRAGLTRASINRSLRLINTGNQAGLYREGKLLIPIIMRLKKDERTGLGAILDGHIWSPNIGRYVPLTQVSNGILKLEEDLVLYRRNRIRTLTAGCFTTSGLNTRFLDEARPQIEEMFRREAKPGYSLQWGGEFESAGDAMRALASNIPLVLILMVSIVVILFNGIVSPLVIVLTVPLAFIGVVPGLLLLRQPFSFMAMLGFISLSGMMIKNTIVLLDQVKEELATGSSPYDSMINAAVNRARPVALGALTTVPGMLPLAWDALFAPLAVTIMFGLTLATLLILVVAPVLYITINRIPSPSREEIAAWEESAS